MSARNAFFSIARRIGLFGVSRLLYRSRLNILCFHGFSMEDEHRFRPSLFMTGEVFESRMQWLADNHFHVLPLADGLSRLDTATLEPRSVVITIDDGFKSVLRVAAPILERFGYPATTYVTTYYVKHQNPIFRLAVQYMLWKSAADPSILTPLLEPACLDRGGDDPMWALIDYGERRLDEDGRLELLRQLARTLHLDFGSLCAAGGLSLLDFDEIRELSERGMDIQLHTHRHRLPRDSKLLAQEIAENREVLEPIIGKNPDHLCYPSGIWHAEQWPTLRNVGVTSATTCDPGMNRSDTPRLGLTRFLDRDDLPSIEFEAELSGFKELMRVVRSPGAPATAHD